MAPTKLCDEIGIQPQFGGIHFSGRPHTESYLGGMYSEWTSLGPHFHSLSEERNSVLNKFPTHVGKNVVTSILKPLASNLGITQASEPSPFVSDEEVQWNMQVICYGLSLPFSEHDTIRDCVSVYCEWLTSLHPVPKISVPPPVRDEPNLYGRKIISHFYNLFVPRKGEAPDTINKQAVLCHRVLRTIQNVSQVSNVMNQETWEVLLMFLLSINDCILSPPIVKDDICDQLCERVLSVLVEVWLLACVRCFPSPPLWKTLREMCMNWRHRIALVEQWNRVHLALTAKLLEFMCGPDFPTLKICDEDNQLIPAEATQDCIVQSWYRFLHCLGNPVNLCRPSLISQTPEFLQYAITSNCVVDPSQHPCLSALPMIFLKAIRGVAGQVDAFLGICSSYLYEDVTGFKKEKDVQPTSIQTPPTQRRLAKSLSVAPSSVSKGIPRASLIGLTSSRASTLIQPSSAPNSGPPSTSSQSSFSSLGLDAKVPIALNRPKCNSILHLFGDWLFEAANIGTDHHTFTTSSKSIPSSLVIDSRKVSVSSSSQPPSLSDDAEAPNLLLMEKYEAGRAEALGALCRIFTAKKTGEEILPVYLSRFYVSLYHGLQIPDSRECTDVISSILINSTDLFRLDLDGVFILLPSYIEALELVFLKGPKASSNGLKTELRQASIQLLLSMIALPLQFQDLQIKELFPSQSDEKNLLTVGELKPRLMNLLIGALEIETDPTNVQMLLGGLIQSVEDTACCEAGETVMQNYSSSNFMSSDCAHGLFISTTYLVCQRLISSWKSDLNVSLAALEVLSALARIHIKETDALEPKRAVKWLCDYIVIQCSRPPPAHSKDLHSTIVAAFSCLSVWLVAHPTLLDDKECLATVLDVVELGISGSISQGKAGEPVKLKDQKELKPASMRVRDAAESLLNRILEQVGYFPSPCGAESLSSLLDELSLLKYCNSWTGGEVDRVTACQRFKYFIIDNSILLALLEEPLGNDQDPQPTVTVIIRGPFGRYAWTMQLRHLPRHKSGTKHQHTTNPGRPIPSNDIGVRHDIRHQHFPDGIERIPACKVDKSIPSMESLNDETVGGEQAKMIELLENQLELEEAMKRVGQQSENSLQFPDPDRECYPPLVKHEFQTARLFLSHFGLLSLDSEQNQLDSPLIMLDTSIPGFCTDLEALDSISSRTCDTVHVFYVRTGQKNVQEILFNVTTSTLVDQRFMEMLDSLGWPVNVHQHPGWTGNTFTSWKLQPIPRQHEEENAEPMPSLYSGEKYVLYWADVSSEIAFVVPTVKSVAHFQTDYESLPQVSGQGWYERSVSVGNGNQQKGTQCKPRTMSLDLEKPGAEPTRPGRRLGVLKNQPYVNPPTKVMLVWLESYEDHITFPVGDLLNYCNTSLESAPPKSEDTYVIFVHALSSGLLRVKLQGPTGRMTLSTPLVDGIVVSERTLSSLVRQTALNICKRKRLDNDSYHPPHVRRRLKVQEFATRYKSNLSHSEMLTSLFS
ncbi:hypothetical protein RUM44_011716 [Polyplax serrata]|uniref:Rap-GAP domain-containing protein n=1 Tax=Polyplax serrata TaxID=468196 RepID=A0ABR1AQT9_POLSC